MFLSRGDDYRNKDHNPEKLPWVPVPLKMISLARKVGTIEQEGKYQSCLSRLRDYTEVTSKHENCPGFESVLRCLVQE
jgi:hypothetical protein